jgi:hypothetical protein
VFILFSYIEIKKTPIFKLLSSLIAYLAFNVTKKSILKKIFLTLSEQSFFYQFFFILEKMGKLFDADIHFFLEINAIAPHKSIIRLPKIDKVSVCCLPVLGKVFDDNLLVLLLFVLFPVLEESPPLFTGSSVYT